jgi:competence protein ComEA
MDPVEDSHLESPWERYKLPILLAVFGIFAAAVILRVVFNYTLKEANQKKVQAAQASIEPPKTAQIKIDISGAVTKPGVYSLGMGARVEDALRVSGGLNAEADTEWVAKQVNLAQKLTDGAKLYIPRESEQKNPGILIAGVLGTESTSESIININTASKDRLDELPGVGAITAQKIIDNRPYQRIEELLSKRVLYKSTFEKIKTKISV